MPQGGSTTPGLSPVQAGVQIVQNMVQCGMDGKHYTREIESLHALMADFAMRELRANHAALIRETLEVRDPHGVTVEDVTDEQHENTAMAEAYWAATSLFFRKVYSAAASAS